MRGCFCFCLAGESGKEPTVKIAAHLFHSLSYGNKDRLCAGIICAGARRPRSLRESASTAACSSSSSSNCHRHLFALVLVHLCVHLFYSASSCSSSSAPCFVYSSCGCPAA